MNLAVTIAACASALANVAVAVYLVHPVRRITKPVARPEDEVPRQFRRPVTPAEKV